ncbi:MAG: LPXTG cell wall anchor domain-containing protein [Oscillibacter sp.]|nr:LPXTG cell wall anchor domain-containing protein [Oscillibacter sp.]
MNRMLRRFCAVFVLVCLLASALPVEALASFPVCGLREHVHDDSCYASDDRFALECSVEDTIHQHTSACFDSGNNLTCHMADFVLHLHDDNCYSDGALVCTLPEIDSSLHSRVDGGFGNIQCVYVPRFSHVHGSDCYVTERVLICELEESVHEHDSACYEKVLVCEIESQEDIDDIAVHEHDDTCYEERLICEVQDGHEHDDDCYVEQEILICDLEAAEIDLTGDVCVHYEYELHTHDTSCMDDSGAYICGKYELESHEHDDSCFTLLGTNSHLICNRLEHRHGFECYLDFDEPDEAPVDEDEPTDEAPEDEPAEDNSEEVAASDDMSVITHPLVDFKAVMSWGNGNYADSAYLRLYRGGEPVPESAGGGIKEVTRDEPVVWWTGLDKYVYADDGTLCYWPYYVVEVAYDDGEYVAVGDVEDTFYGEWYGDCVDDIGRGITVSYDNIMAYWESDLGETGWYPAMYGPDCVMVSGGRNPEDVVNLCWLPRMWLGEYIWDSVAAGSLFSQARQSDAYVRVFTTYYEQSVTEEYRKSSDNDGIVTSIPSDKISFEATRVWLDDAMGSDEAYLQLYKGGWPVSAEDGGVKRVTRENSVALWEGLDANVWYGSEENPREYFWPYYVIEVTMDADGDYLPVGRVTNSFEGAQCLDIANLVSYTYGPVMCGEAGFGASRYPAVYGYHAVWDFDDDDVYFDEVPAMWLDELYGTFGELYDSPSLFASRPDDAPFDYDCYYQILTVSSAFDKDIRLEFIKADSRGKPANSFADGSRVPEAIPDNDGIFTELGTNGPSYEWLDKHGYLIDGALFGLDYWYYDENGNEQRGKQACWSGGVEGSSVSPDEFGYKSYLEWLSYVVDDGDTIPSGKICFSLPGTTYEWHLTEVCTLSEYDRYSSMQYCDAGIVDTAAAYLYGSFESGEVVMRWRFGEGFEATFVEVNPGYNGVMPYASGDEYDFSYTGNILWNQPIESEPKGTKLEFIKADSRGKPANSFADGSTSSSEGPSYEDLARDGLLIDGALFGLEYSYKDENGKSQTGKQACWSGGVANVPEDYSLQYNSWERYIVAVDPSSILSGKVVFYLPDTTYYWELYEVITPDDYVDGSFVYFNDAGIVDASSASLLWTAFVGRYDEESKSFHMQLEYEVRHDLEFVESNPEFQDVSSEISLFASGYDLSIPYTGNILWNRQVESEPEPGVLLPNTGGAGATPIVMGCGAGLLVFAGGMAVYRRRKVQSERTGRRRT